MFLNKVIDRNKQLVDCAVQLSKDFKIRPDTFVVDVDQFKENSKIMLDEAKANDVKLYFMLKQLGRNPYLARILTDMGYSGAVVVDYKEAEVLMKHNIPICNVGHLVQTPNYLIEDLIVYGVDYFTVFSIEKIRKINMYAKKHDVVQKLMLRVIDDSDLIYSGQKEGILLKDFEELVKQVKELENVQIDCLTVFPAILFDSEKQAFVETENLNTMKKAESILSNLGIHISELNVPSATCTSSIPLIKQLGGTIGEPGHGLTGTTPGHAVLDLEEKTAVVYVSEVSHNFKNHAYFFGGGFYRRGHWKNAYVVKVKGETVVDEVILPDLDSIDYYIGLQDNHDIGDIVISAFRFQMFTARSDIVLVEGIHSEQPLKIHRYGPLGEHHE